MTSEALRGVGRHERNRRVCARARDRARSGEGGGRAEGAARGRATRGGGGRARRRARRRAGAERPGALHDQARALALRVEPRVVGRRQRRGRRGAAQQD